MALDPAKLRAELRGLRREQGRTLTKLLRCYELRAALGDPPDGQLMSLFDTAVADLGADLWSLALKNAYAIGVKDPANLTTRREDFGALKSVSRGPETVNNWENGKIDELVAHLLAGEDGHGISHWLVAVAIEAGRIVVVGEGEAERGNPMRQLFNPQSEPFFPGFIYKLPPHASPGRLTISAYFLDAAPAVVYAEAAGDLLAFICGDGRQKLSVSPGGIPGLEQAAAHADVHWKTPEPSVYYGLYWKSGAPLP